MSVATSTRETACQRSALALRLERDWRRLFVVEDAVKISPASSSCPPAQFSAVVCSCEATRASPDYRRKARGRHPPRQRRDFGDVVTGHATRTRREQANGKMASPRAHLPCIGERQPTRHVGRSERRGEARRRDGSPEGMGRG